MSHIFISYKSEERHIAYDLVRLLESRGYPCWIDDRELPGGGVYPYELKKAILASRALVFLHSELSDKSRQTVNELAIATNYGIPIIPVELERIEDAKMEYLLASRSYIFAYGGLTDDVILRVIKGIEEGNQGAPSAANAPLTHPTPSMGIKGPEVLSVQELLDKGYSAHYLAAKEIELDYLTVDTRKYLIPDEVEGTAEDWEESVVECADCSAGLIVDDELVGYLDLFPIKHENLVPLTTDTPFDASYIEFYSLGGDYDVFASMFSFDKRHATQKNFLLFVDFLLKTLYSWREQGIEIHNIAFSLYLDAEAKLLSSIGFRLVNENPLKGMVYQSSFAALATHPVVARRLKLLGLGKEVHYSYVSGKDSDIIKKCEAIASSYHISNGGPLRFSNLLGDCSEVIVALSQGEAVGYLGLREYPSLPDGLYIEQIAVKREFLRQGVGKELLSRAKSRAEKKALYANVAKENSPSRQLFLSSGFVSFPMSEATYLDLGFESSDIEETDAYVHNG